jgi:predicted RNA binding protein YcfA (HicA-like mRNA interferase family)
MSSNLYRELVRLLRDAGCELVRQGKGSHEIWYSPITKRRFSVPCNTVKVHTANGVLKDAGLPKAF